MASRGSIGHPSCRPPVRCPRGGPSHAFITPRHLGLGYLGGSASRGGTSSEESGQMCRIGTRPFVERVGSRHGRGSVSNPLSRPGDPVKLLLPAGGVTNASIRDALVDLLGKPIDEST